MKVKVKETGEIIDVYMLYPVTYSRLDCNHKIIEEYDEDEIEFIHVPLTEKDVVDKINNYLESLLNDNDMEYTETLHDLIIERFNDIAETQYRKYLGK